MKFLVDPPLGGLMKWLRFCGFDATALSLHPDAPQALPPPIPDTYILTRQTTFKRLRRPDILILAAHDPQTQLEEVVRLLKISRRDLSPLSRCSRCNDLLVSISRDQVQGRVPEHIFLHHRQFSECPRCHRLFWPGSHLPEISEKVLTKLPDEGEGEKKEDS
jgi:uncharacterized protein with PIN domain